VAPGDVGRKGLSECGVKGVRAGIPLFTRLIEGRNKFVLGINRKLESLDGSVVFAAASFDPVSCGTQGTVAEIRIASYAKPSRVVLARSPIGSGFFWSLP
jgi:hypothetical protein